jgi:hypothetical protein
VIYRSGGGVEHSVELSVQLVGWVVFDASEGECPSAGYGTYLAANSAPGSKVPLAFVVCNVAGLVSWNSDIPSQAFRHYMMIVQFTHSYAAIAEITSHSGSSFFQDVWFLRNRFQTKKLAGLKKTEIFGEIGTNSSLVL